MSLQRRSSIQRGPRRLLGAPHRRDAEGGESDDGAPPPRPRSSLPARLPALGAEPGVHPPEGQRAVPDLLNLLPSVTVEAQKLSRALTFSFVAGNDGGVLRHALERAPLAASTFEPECFFAELFAEDMLRSVMSFQLDGKARNANAAYLLRVFSQPPADPRVRELRTAVWRELSERPELHAAVMAVFRRIAELVSLFEGDDQSSVRGEQTRRRIDVLRAISAAVHALNAPALGTANSVLRRIAEYGARVAAADGFLRLEELLRYENERAYADLTLQISADGRIRGLRVVAVREDHRNRYHVPAWRQILGRVGLWFRGYRVSDGEIIDRWLDEVFDDVCEFLPPLIQLHGDLEWYLAGLSFRDHCQSRGLAVCFPTFIDRDDDTPCRLEALFNPLLLGQGTTPVACDVALSPEGVTTLITGPNSGGKTRLLQAVGLMQLCAQAGMFVPAARAVMRSVPGIFASLTQPASADQSEGRLGTELLRIRMMFERASPGTLVLVDELCSGTSPSEGEELFRLVLELLIELRPLSLISTHFLRFAQTLAESEGPGSTALPLSFLQVELDAQQRPTYRFLPGVAETSLAQQTAARLGVTREELRALLVRKSQRWPETEMSSK